MDEGNNHSHTHQRSLVQNLWQTARKTPRRIAIVVLIALLITVVIWYRQHSNSTASPLPDTIVSSLAFSPYYPSKLPPGYRYINNSAKLSNGFLYYSFKNGSKTITVTEEAVPPGVNINALPQHTTVRVPIGKAVIGVSVGNPSVVINTSSILINMTSSKGVSQNDMLIIARAFRLVDSQSQG